MADTAHNVKYHYSRLDATTTTIHWESNQTQNMIAIILGYLATQFITNMANKTLDHILLSHFPHLAVHWCFVRTQNPQMSRLRRTQMSCWRGVVVATVLLRWPGWRLFHLHLWECIRLAVAVLGGLEAVLVGALLVLHAFVRTGEKLAALTGWDPVGGGGVGGGGGGGGGRVLCMVTEGAEPATPLHKFCGPHMMRKHPSSVGMGRFLKDVRLEGVNMADTFVAREWNSGRKEDEMVVYHAITTQEKFWDGSFEELRLQHYKETGRFESPVVSSGQDEPEEEESFLGRSVGKVLPFWLSSRTFRDSAFSCSTSSLRSDDSFAKLNNASLAAGKVGDPSVLPSTLDLLTGEGLLMRRFT